MSSLRTSGIPLEYLRSFAQRATSSVFLSLLCTVVYANAMSYFILFAEARMCITLGRKELQEPPMYVCSRSRL